MEERRRSPVPIALAVLAVLLAVAFAATRLTGLMGVPDDTGSGEAAPEFAGIEAWLNSEPLTIAGLRGSVVLVDFWTYSCVNCVRALPDLRALYARYHSFGLEIVGVHAPEFAFEKDRGNVSDAVRRLDVPYPVAMDNDMTTWAAYGNRYWPHVYAIDAEGRIRYDKIGEGGEDELQDHVRALLTAAGKQLPEPLDFSERVFDRNLTPEIYAGFRRGVIQGGLTNREGYEPGLPVTYAPVEQRAIDAAGTDGAFFLEGTWTSREEFARADADGAKVILPFFARDVHVVASGRARVHLLLDGAPLDVSIAGEDVDGGAIDVDRADLYTALRLPRAERHVLTLEATEGFELFTFTFG